MLLTIITALIFTLSLIYIIVDRYGENLIAWTVSTISGFFLLLMIIVITVTQFTSYDEYNQAVSERETIVASLEVAESAEAVAFLTPNVIEFNKKVDSVESWTGVWFGWFVNERLTTLDKIDIKDYTTPKD